MDLYFGPLHFGHAGYRCEQTKVRGGATSWHRVDQMHLQQVLRMFCLELRFCLLYFCKFLYYASILSAFNNSSRNLSKFGLKIVDIMRFSMLFVKLLKKGGV